MLRRLGPDLGLVEEEPRDLLDLRHYDANKPSEMLAKMSDLSDILS